MALGFSIRGIGTVAGVQAVLKRRGNSLVPKSRLAMERVVKTLERDVKLKALGGTGGSDPFWGKTGAPGDQLARVTGKARQTIVALTLTRLASVVGVVGSPLAYMAMHEWGGTIRGNQYLRIPTKWMKKPSGQDRLTGRSARSLPGTALFRSRAGNLFIWEVGTPRAKASPSGAIPLYLLKPSVTLRARHLFRNTLRRGRAMIHEAFGLVAASVKRG